MDPFRLFKRKEGAASPLLGKGRDVASALGSGAEKLDATRAAYNTGDSARSKSLHDGNAAAAAEDHGGSAICGYELGDFIKSVVFGGLDGIITTCGCTARPAGLSRSSTSTTARRGGSSPSFEGQPLGGRRSRPQLFLSVGGTIHGLLLSRRLLLPPLPAVFMKSTPPPLQSPLWRRPRSPTFRCR